MKKNGVKEFGKKNLVVGSIIFSLATFAILLAVWLFAEPFNPKHSISYYVGYTIPSAIAFLIVNILSVYNMHKFYIGVINRSFDPGHKELIVPGFKNRKALNFSANFYYVLGVLIMIGLIGLSVFPIHLFERMNPALGFTSEFHRIFSRSMFVIMSIQCFYTGWHFRQQKKVLIPNMIFAVYAIICCTAFLATSSFFWTYDFIFESVFVVGYFLTLFSHLAIKTKGEDDDTD